MFEPGDKLTIRHIQSGEEQESQGRTVVSCEDGLLEVQRGGQLTVFNMRASTFVSAVKRVASPEDLPTIVGSE